MANVSSDELIRGYAEALFRVVQAEGEIDRVEDELFRFGKLVDSNYQLKQALSDQSLGNEQRAKILEDLLADKVSPHTLGLLRFVVEQGRARHLPQILETLSSIAAESRDSVVAEVRTAVALSEFERGRLTEALATATGKKVELKVIVDPTVIAGVVAKIGDTVIDGTVRRRLEQLREQVRT